jgi:hypothetical protein
VHANRTAAAADESLSFSIEIEKPSSRQVTTVDYYLKVVMTVPAPVELVPAPIAPEAGVEVDFEIPAPAIEEQELEAPPVAIPPLGGSSGRVSVGIRGHTGGREGTEDEESVKEFAAFWEWVSDVGSPGQTLVSALAQGMAPSTFLVVMEDQVVAIHTTARYLNQLGRPPRAAMHNRDFVLAGELIGDQMAILRGPATQGSRFQDMVETRETLIPTDDELAGGDGPFIEAIPAVEGRPTSPIPKAVLIPLSWAEYFLSYRSFVETLAWIAAKRETLTPAQRETTQPLEHWARAIRVRATGTNTVISALDGKWQAPAPDPVLIQFMRDRLNQLFPQAQPTTSNAGPAGQPIFRPTINLVSPGTSPDKEKKLASGEKARIRAACSLAMADFDPCLPPFYRAWLQDGKTKESVRTWMTHYLTNNGPVSRLYPSQVYVSDDMVNDIKSLNFGRGGDLTHGDCHRGLSPFMCPAVPAKRRREMDKRNEFQARATAVTPDDIKNSETGPGELPTGLYGLQQQLGRYSAILEVLAGEQCRHKAEVDAIMEALTDNSDQFEEMTQRQVLYLLWDIHRDARKFFSRVAPLEDGDHLLPRTNLNVVSRMVQGGNIMTSAVGVPELDFLGKNITHDILTSAGGGTPQELFPGASTAYTGPHANPTVVPEFAATLAPLLKIHPKINVFELLRQVEGVHLSDITVGRRGHHCNNYSVLGRCADRKCRYQHTPTRPSAERIKKVDASLRQIVGSVLANGLKKE